MVLKFEANNRSEFDKKLIEECKKENRKYQKIFYKNFYGYVLNISRLYTYSKEEAEEVANDSFIKLFSSIHLIDPQLPLKGWIRRVTINTAIDNYRKNKKHYFHVDADDLKNFDVSELDEDVISRLTFEEILNHLNRLPAVIRLVFNLYEIQGYSHEEIANHLNISVSSSRVYLMRAKKQLKSLLNHFA